jgi:methylenetetrahydrofolate dehydrogenase (NADP+) / methenyltetrahydrofolate cyclohydrolase
VTPSPQILDGKSLSLQIMDEIAEEVKQLKSQFGKAPHLAAILVGDDGASRTYVDSKVSDCEKVGFDSTLLKFPATTSEEKLLKEIDRLNEDTDIHGFIVQLPLPAHISVEKVNKRIRSEKDVDGFTNDNFGSIVSDKPGLLPATPYGVMELLRRYKIPTQGKHCVVVGKSRIVGSPMSILMAQHGNATVTLCHIHTVDLAYYTRQADIVIVAVGKPGLITGDMVKEGVVVVDIGITRVDDSSAPKGFRLKGDVAYDEVAPKSSYITPVPGGVGPMTRAALLLNTLKAAKKQIH